jgi:hypothetical protein
VGTVVLGLAAQSLFCAKQWIIETIVGYEIARLRLLQNIERGGAGEGLCADSFTGHGRFHSSKRCLAIGLCLLG